MSYTFHLCQFPAFLISDTETQPSRAGSRVWLTAEVWQVDLRATLCSLWRNALKQGRISERKGGLALSSFASGVSRMASLYKSAWQHKSIAAFAVWSHLLKKLIIGLQASPTQPGQKTAPRREGRRRKRWGKRGRSETKRDITTKKKKNIAHNLLAIFSRCPQYGLLFIVCLDSKWLIKPPWLFLHHSWLLNHVWVCACEHVEAMKKTSDFWICMQTFMCLSSLLPQHYFHVT